MYYVCIMRGSTLGVQPNPNIELDTGSMLRYGGRGGLALVRGHKQVADKQRHVSHLQLWAALPASTAEQRAK